MSDSSIYDTGQKTCEAEVPQIQLYSIMTYNFVMYEESYADTLVQNET